MKRNNRKIFFKRQLKKIHSSTVSECALLIEREVSTSTKKYAAVAFVPALGGSTKPPYIEIS